MVLSFLTSDNFWSAFLGRITGVRFLVGSIRNEQLPVYKEFITKLLQKYVLDYIIFNSYSGLNAFIRRGFLPEKSLVIHNCIEITSAAISRKKKNKIKILTVARFVPQKDFHTALKAVWYLKEHLVRKPVEIEYDIVGFGNQEKQIKRWIDEYDMSEYVHLIIHPGNLPEYFEKADIYLSTSLFEGLSNSILEAMSYSLPVVATDVGDNRLIVKNDETGYIVPVREYMEIARKLNELLNSYEKRTSFGLNGYKLLTENYSMNKFRNEYVRFIRTLTR
ncbi:MAG: glycosyltransferase [Bacteroidales bacterium]